MSVLDMIAVDLGSTATYRDRRASFVPHDAGEMIGTLTIVLVYARRNRVE